MRIVIDVQGMQTPNRFHGIGRYVRGLTEGMLKNKGDHEVFILVNGSLKETTREVEEYFSSLIDHEHFIYWYPSLPLAYLNSDSGLNRKQAAVLYQYAILQCQPDLLIVGSLFEGLADDVVVSVDILKNHCRTACVVYDFIPAEDEKTYLADERFKTYYYEQYNKLGDFDLLLGISEYVKTKIQERFSDKKILAISTATDDIFTPFVCTKEQEEVFLKEKGINKPFILYTGGLHFRKNINGLIKAYSLLSNKVRESVQLVICYGKDENGHRILIKECRRYGLKDTEYRLLNYLSDTEFIQLYSFCKLLVYPSFNEGFGLPVLEAMKCGTVALTSNCTSMPEVVGIEDACFDPTSVQSIANKIEQVLTNPDLYLKLKEHCKNQANKFTWNKTAKRLLDYDFASLPVKSRVFLPTNVLVSEAVKQILTYPHTQDEMVLLAKNLCKTFYSKETTKRQLFIDISELHRTDAGTGIQRVVKNISQELVKLGGGKYLIRPVYFDQNSKIYRYAFDWTLKNLNIKLKGIDSDTPIGYFVNDIFFGLDLVPFLVDQYFDQLLLMQKVGVRIGFNVYDLILVLHPEYFPNGINAKSGFLNWLRKVSLFDFLIFNTRATLERYKCFYLEGGELGNTPKLEFYHLGSNLLNAMSSKGLPEDANDILGILRERPSFLHVSTIEPRKGHAQLLDAFDELIRRNVNCNLVFVGKQGWMVESLIEKIKKHPEQGNRFFWLNGISDEYLAEVYNASTCVVNPSMAEGFGLSLIEAAHHNKPLIIRDLPEFKEIAKENAFYFSCSDGCSLADAIEEWLNKYAENPDDEMFQSKMMKCLSWEESAKMLLGCLMKNGEKVI